MEHICSSKQIKLLVTPLRAKLSKTPIVIKKRCDIFVYLLEKLQDKAFLCLGDFLEFCFGPFEAKNDLEKIRHGKSVPEVCIKSTKILVEILGHSHKNTENCVQTNDIKLHKSIINTDNFPILAEILLNSVVECCTLLNEWNSDSSQCNTIIMCLWRSLLHLIQCTNNETKKKCCIQLSSLLRKLTERLDFNRQVYTILGNVFQLIIKSDLSGNLKDVLFDVTINLLRHETTDYCSFNEEEALNYINACFESENYLKFSKIASTYFKNTTKCVNPKPFCEVWLKCHLIVNPPNISSLIWPVRHFKHFKDTKVLNRKWTTLYNECKFEPVQVNVLQEMEKIFIENPLLSTNVVNFLQLISRVENNSSKDFVMRFMRLIELVLTLPNILESDLKKLTSIILKYCDQKKLFYKLDGIDEALDKLCGCLNNLIIIHKDYSVLPSLYNYLKEVQPKILLKFSKRLMFTLEGLMLNENDAILNNTRKLMELLEIKESEPDSFPLSSTRSLRIIHMTNTPKQNPTRFFGRSSEVTLDSKSRTSLRVSKRHQVTISDDKSSDYVKIDTEVKLDVSNLSDHQKEIMKKRKEDIPALYNDLTQSQSRDFFTDSQEVGKGSEENLVTAVGAPVCEELKKRSRSEDETDQTSKKAKLEESTLKIEDSPSQKVEESLKNSDSTEKITQTLETTLTVPSKDSKFENKQVPRKMSRQKQEFSSPLKLNDKNKDKTKQESQNVNEEKFEDNAVGNENTTPDLKTEEKDEDKILNPNQEPKSPGGRLQVFVARRGGRGRKENRNKSINDSESRNSSSVLEEKAIRKSRRQQLKRMKTEKSLDLIENLNKPKTDNLDKSNIEGKSPEALKTLLIERGKKMEGNPKVLLEKTETLKTSRGSPSKNRNSDSNQNKIKPETDNLSKQEKIRQIVSEVKEKVMGNNESSSKKRDVYEFTGDEDYAKEELKKAARKTQKKRVPFGMLGYVRRKKIKKTEDKRKNSQDISYHVTADFTPLSESQTLRAVSSPQEGETITILITRNPLEVESKPESSQEIDSSPSKGRNKRKSPEVNSEDVIESSQPDTEANSPRRKKNDSRYSSISRRQSRRQTLEKKTEEDRTPQVEKQKKEEEKEEKKEEEKQQKTGEEKQQKTEEEKQQKKEEEKEKEEEQNEKPSMHTVPRRRFSLTETPEEKKLAKRQIRTRSLDKFDAEHKVTFLTKTLEEEMETVSEILEQIPDTLTQPTKEDIPSSPITCDTPDRTTEFLNNTLDISPINSVYEEEDTTPKIPSTEVSNVRVARLLQMVNSNVQVSERRWFANKKQTSSPSTSRVRKMRLKQEENVDILTFSREVPSPLTVPASGILKRKFGDLEETAAPSPKRKRVNFSDPAITEKKIFIKDSEEYDLLEQNNEITNQDLEKLLFDGMDREDTIDTIKELCDSKLKDLSADSTKLKDTLKSLISNLNVPEIVEVVTEFLTNLDKDTMGDVNGALAKSDFVKLAFLPLMEAENVFDLLLPKLIEVLEKLPDSKLQQFLSEIVKAFGYNRFNNVIKEETNHKQMEEHVVNNFDCDKMKELIKKYIAVLEDQKRNDFLIDLMSLASTELPVNKEFVNWHVNVLQDFVKRMND